jgi:hypothetical protein
MQKQRDRKVSLFVERCVPMWPSEKCHVGVQQAGTSRSCLCGLRRVHSEGGNQLRDTVIVVIAITTVLYFKVNTYSVQVNHF